MAVQKNKKSKSKKNMKRSHKSLKNPLLSIDKLTGELHLRHNVSTNGFYKGKKAIEIKSKK